MARTATIAPGGLDYKKCTRKELDQFYKQRTGKDVTNIKGLNKHKMVIELRRKDRRPGVFRFLDLPAEMRNHVYRELLELRPGNDKRSPHSAHPTVLRTCHQIYEEGRSILYGDNVPEIQLQSGYPTYYTGPWPARRGVSLYTSVNGVRMLEQSGTPQLRSARWQWFDELRRFQSIRVVIKVELDGRAPLPTQWESFLVWINHDLYSLCSFLSTSTALKTIALKISIEDPAVPLSHLAQGIWPLSLLTASPNDLTDASESELMRLETILSIAKEPQKMSTLQELRATSSGYEAACTLVQFPFQDGQAKLTDNQTRVEDLLRTSSYLDPEKVKQIEVEVAAFQKLLEDEKLCSSIKGAIDQNFYSTEQRIQMRKHIFGT